MRREMRSDGWGWMKQGSAKCIIMPDHSMVMTSTSNFGAAMWAQ